MNLTDSQKKIFAILFAAGEPLETDRLAEALAISHAEAAEQCVLLQQRLAESELPLELRRLENSWQLCTIAGYDAVIRTALELRSNTPLSNAAMEVLAVVAYNQPVTRSFIEQVRGVDSSSVVASLEEKGLVTAYEREAAAGKPRRYYHLTKAGEAALREKETAWHTYADAVGRVLGGGACCAGT